MLWTHFDGQAARFYYQQIIAKRGRIFALEQDEKALHPLKTIYNIFRSGTYLSETDACEICDGHPDLVR